MRTAPRPNAPLDPVRRPRTRVHELAIVAYPYDRSNSTSTAGSDARKVPLLLQLERSPNVREGRKNR